MNTNIGRLRNALGFGQNNTKKEEQVISDNTRDTAVDTEDTAVATAVDTEVAQDDSSVAQNIPGDNDIIDKITSNLNTLFAGINESNNKSKDHIKDIEGNLKRIQEALQNQELQEKVSELEGKIRTINAEKDGLNTTIKELKAAQEKLEEKIRQKKEENSEAITNKNKLSESNRKLSQQNEKLKTNIEALQQKLAEKNKEINGKLTQINELVTKNMKLEGLKNVENELSTLKEAYKKLLEDNPVWTGDDTTKDDRQDSKFSQKKPDTIVEKYPKSAVTRLDDTFVADDVENESEEFEGGRKTRHRGKSRKNKKTRKNKKQKKTTKK